MKRKMNFFERLKVIYIQRVKRWFSLLNIHIRFVCKYYCSYKLRNYPKKKLYNTPSSMTIEKWGVHTITFNKNIINPISSCCVDVVHWTNCIYIFSVESTKVFVNFLCAFDSTWCLVRLRQQPKPYRRESGKISVRNTF